MTITLNGERREVSGAATVAALLDELAIDPRLVAVEVNRVVIKRARFESTRLEEGAEVEIVGFVGGGGPLAGRRRNAVQ
jgi:sulfur carrier protein